ncbi:MAG: cyclohexadienyl dehydrogenase, partial [Bosea sp. 32-68-6]
MAPSQDSFAPRRDAPLFGRLAIIGIGLIGSSIAHAAKALNLAGRVVLYDREPEVRQRARELGLGHEIAETAAAAVADADHIVLCVPVGACGAVAAEIAAMLKPGAVLSDVGSVKNAVVEAVTPHLPEGVHFVPAHPVAGTENSGPDAGFPSLFLNRWCILTPAEGTDPAAIAATRQFWEGMGAIVEVMTASHHDLVLAVTSHLP